MLAGLKTPTDPNVLVGMETSDDAAVYRLTDEIAMISTADFITPPVDDPYWFGQISAANSISDVYAMGGRPLTALNLVMFPASKLDLGILKEILRGGSDKIAEAGASLVGGHTVDDDEPKYGLSVCGVVHPQRILANAGAQPGDALVLTKPVGAGVLFNAVRAGKFPFAELERETLPVVASLNDKAMAAALPFAPHACTDITGFGLLGHLLEVALGSKVRAVLDWKTLPFYSGAADMYRQGVRTSSNAPNRALADPHLEMQASMPPAEEELLYDPQTSGGLLFSLPGQQADALLAALHEAGIHAAARIGEVVAGPAGVVVV